MSVAAIKPRLSEAQFLLQERRAETKSEFFDGGVFAMAGGTRVHSLIATNLTHALVTQLEGRPCVTYNADLRIKVEATGLLTYPDASVICGPERFLDDKEDTLLNPTLVAEVLSDSTEAYDRGTKFHHYVLITSLHYILFASQHEPRLECYTRKGSDWILSQAIGLNAVLTLPGLKITLALSQVYARVEFSSVRGRLHP